MHKTVGETEALPRRASPAASAELGGVDVVVCPPFTALAAAVERDAAGSPIADRRPEHARGGVGRLHRRGLVADAARPRRRGRDRRPLRAPPALLRDRRGAGAQGPGAARRRAAADPLRRRDRGRARRRRDRGGAARARSTADLAEVADARPGRGRDRLRADLGDRHRPHRDARAGRGGDRLHPRAGRRARRGRRGARSGSSTAARSSPATPPSCSRRADIDGGLVGGASLDPEDFLAICEAADG